MDSVLCPTISIDAPRDPCLVLREPRIGRDGEIPEACPLGLVLDLADSHRLHRGVCFVREREQNN
jgi:hypothetical protein